MPEPEQRSLEELADAAFRQAAVKVIRRARETGGSIITWEDGQVKAISPDEAQARMEAELERQLGNAGTPRSTVD